MRKERKRLARVEGHRLPVAFDPRRTQQPDRKRHGATIRATETVS
jgi:hypothetical protein